MKPKLTFSKYILVCVLTVSLCVVLYLSSEQNRHEWESILPELELACTTSQGHIDKLTQDNAALSAQISTLSAEISSLRQEVERKQDKADRGGERGTRRIMSVTAYDLSVESCGKLPNHPEYGITASGVPVKEWYTVASGPELPFGTKIFIPFFADKPNGGVFTVQDRGSAVKDGCIDVYIADNAACWEFGRQRLEVWVME
jgi:3D (Asp-Asp-Asp) domain-containing protein